jgi:hypothetical protein
MKSPDLDVGIRVRVYGRSMAGIRDVHRRSTGALIWRSPRCSAGRDTIVAAELPMQSPSTFRSSRLLSHPPKRLGGQHQLSTLSGTDGNQPG